MRKLLITLSIIGLCFSSYAKQVDDSKRNTYVESITQEDLKKHLSILASDEYEGRETGTKGQKMAAEYIANHFKTLGLIGPVKDSDNPYYQSFELEKTSWDTITIEADGKKMEGFDQFAPYGGFEMNETVDIVFAGYGIEDEKYSDYKDLDVKGKLIVFISGEPKGKDGNFIISGTEKNSPASGTRSKITAARSKGALGAIMIDNNYAKRASYYKSVFSRPSIRFKSEGKSRPTFAIFYASKEGAAQMLGASSKSFGKVIKKMEKKGTSLAGKLKNQIKLEASLKRETVVTENVLGFLEGTDKKDEILVITSHYDHIGIGAEGQINNGADDDGSGTVGVLEIAEAFSKAASEGARPRRSILFMTVTGEEKGLLGSEYYSENPIFDLEKTVTNLNIDMIGRVDDEHKDNPNYVYIIGSDMLSSELHSLSESVAKKYKPDFTLDYTYNDKDDPNRFYYRSDHYNFAKHNIPVIFYFNGTHPDYHKPTDTVDKIHFEKLMNTSHLVFQTAWELANRDNRVVVDKAVKE